MATAQEGITLQGLVDEIQTQGDPVEDGALPLGSDRRVEQRPQPLVQFAADEVEPFQHAPALHAAERRQHADVTLELGQVLQDDRVLGEHLVVLQFQARHVALGVDGVEVATALDGMGLQVHLDQFMGQTQFAQHDMRRQRAGSRRVVELHACLLADFSLNNLAQQRASARKAPATSPHRTSPPA
ncbi:hypothetical protein D9M71_591690 [compost metagenome]